MSNGNTTTSFVAPRELVDQVRQLAAERDRSVSAEIRRAIAEHIQRERAAPAAGDT
jgi:predicted transcriptional regulator